MSFYIIDYDEYIKKVEWLNKKTKEYDEGKPSITDGAWDEIYFMVQKWERDNPDQISSLSPTQHINYKVVNELKKVRHNHPMLSLNKTKEVDEVLSWLNGRDYVIMAKMDGLTCSLHYKKGKLVSAETRGNGVVGEDITHNAMVIRSIPKRIDTDEDVTIDGEIICNYENFKEFEGEYKNPRNFSAGSIRLLDSNECARRKLTFVAWDLIEPVDEISKYKSLQFKLIKLLQWNFVVVPYSYNSTLKYSDNYDYEKELSDNITVIKKIAERENYPIDGVVFKLDDIKEYNAEGRTDHHFKGGLAYKFYDETYETRLKDVEWSMGRTGVLTPIAVFDPIDIDGSTVERASLHNYSVMLETLHGPGWDRQKIQVFKANQIIPQIAEAEEDNDGRSKMYIGVPGICPYCNSIVSIVTSDAGVKNLVCDNPNCEGKLINRLDHFCGKKGLDIKGLSKKTLEKLIDWGWVNNLIDIFKLPTHAKEWIEKPGFGQASVFKILDAVDFASAEAPLSAFISGLGIPLIGTRVAKQICEHVETWKEFRELIDSKFNFMKWDGFGPEMYYSLIHFNYEEADKIASFLTFKPEEVKEVKTTDELTGKNFVITGKLIHHKNRQELVDKIEAAGGKVQSAVNAKTNYLINNDITSTSAKNKKAKELNVPIITEEDFMEMIK